MSDTLPNDLIIEPLPNCPLCGGDTLLAPMHKAVEKVLNIFRCRKCGVEYPMVKRK